MKPGWHCVSGRALAVGGRLLAAWAVAAALAAPVLAQGPGREALEAGDYRRALTILEPQARRGAAEAQYLLGVMREKGLGVAIDLERARHWYGLAAQQGHAEARQALSRIDFPAGAAPATPAQQPTAASQAATHAPAAMPLAAGTVDDAQRLQAMIAGDVPIDRPAAERHASALAIRAEAGDATAAVLLGEYFESAISGAADYAAAARWYEVAARKDQAVALNNLGAMYYDGRGVVQSYAEAQRLYLRAAQAGNAVAQFNLALMLGQGRDGPPDNEAMLAWLRRSVTQGYARAQAQLARFHYEGQAVERDRREAARLFALAAQQGLPSAQYWTARLLTRGEGTVRDLEQGATWMRRAAEAGMPAAMHELAVAYELGLGIVSDPAQAIAWYRRAGEANVAEAATRLAAAYTKGELGLAPDPGEAARWGARIRP
ncbi:MAG: sel1 repeat family protein [Burkholderiales bacterium]|nr:sel1 repeat family protein [Burkholderiales bacterium]